MHMAIYRAYRPAFFRDVIGQDHITSTLKNEVRDDRVAHAYLFTGSRGTGKTTCAKILAKAVNCLHPVDGEPCGECEICRGIDEGTILDVVEIDAASNNGVDYVRALREEAYYTPVKAKFRVYIIDEVHMLSQGAFNALLKIMEEPPAHVIFILATTEVHKILATILSRCQRFDFMRVNERDIADRILAIAKQEDFRITDDAALLLGRLGDGAVRDSLSVLDKCLSVSRDLTEEDVLSVTGVTDGGLLMDLAMAVLQGAYESVLQLTAKFYDHSKDFSVLCSQLITLYRDILMVKLGVRQSPLTRGIPQSRFEEAAGLISDRALISSLRALCKCRDEMGRVLDARTQLEITLAEMTLGYAEMPIPAATMPTEPSSPMRKKAVSAAPQTAPRKGETPSRTAFAPSQDQTVFEPWEQVLSALQKINSALWSTLIGSKAYLDGNRILIDAENPLFFDMMRSNEDSRGYIKSALMEVTGKTFSLGPYQRKKQTENEKLKDLLERANAAGIPVEIQD